MADLLAGLRVYHTRLNLGGPRGLPLLAIFVAKVVGLPPARALLTAGLLGGVVIGVMLILARQQPGPRRGTPITLFPKPVNLKVSGV